VAKLIVPPGLFPVGWSLKFKNGEEDWKKKLRRSGLEDFYRKSAPFSVLAFDEEGREREVKDLKEEIRLDIWTGLPDEQLVSAIRKGRRERRERN
jgi:hypothetical protein